jgi:hypothetical protein
MQEMVQPDRYQWGDGMGFHPAPELAGGSERLQMKTAVTCSRDLHNTEQEYVERVHRQQCNPKVDLVDDDRALELHRRSA